MQLDHTTRYWQAVRAKQAELEAEHGKDCHVVSLPDLYRNAQAGVVCAVTCRAAAEAIINGSHELASAEQVTEHLADQARRRDAILRHEASRGEGGERRVFIAVPPPKD